MGWIGSLLTIRGIPLVTHKYVPIVTTTRIAQPKPQANSAKQEKPVTKPKQVIEEPKTQLTPEPELEEPQAILIPPQNQGEE